MEILKLKVGIFQIQRPKLVPTTYGASLCFLLTEEFFADLMNDWACCLAKFVWHIAVVVAQLITMKAYCFIYHRVHVAYIMILAIEMEYAINYNR